MTSPTARTLQTCRKRGWIAQVVEQTIPHKFIKRDYLGCIDILAITDASAYADGQEFTVDGQVCVGPWTMERMVIGIQATSGANHASRRTKALAEPRLKAWLEAGGRFEIWSFSKRGPRGKRKKWELRIEAITLDDFMKAEAA